MAADGTLQVQRSMGKEMSIFCSLRLTPKKLRLSLAGRQFIGDIANSDLRQFQLTFNTNFWGPVRVLQAALPLMPTTGECVESILTTIVTCLQGVPDQISYSWHFTVCASDSVLVREVGRIACKYARRGLRTGTGYVVKVRRLSRVASICNTDS